MNKTLSVRSQLILMTLTILLIIVALSLIMLSPDGKGYYLQDLRVDSAYIFDNLQYQLTSGHTLSFQDKGFLLPIEDYEEILGIAIYGSGNIIYQGETKRVNECYLFIPQQQFYDLLAHLSLSQHEDAFFINRANNNLEYALQENTYLETPVGRKYFPFQKDGLSIIIRNREGFQDFENSHYPYPKGQLFYLLSLCHIMLTGALFLAATLLTERESKREYPDLVLTRTQLQRALYQMLGGAGIFMIILILQGNLLAALIILISTLLLVLYGLSRHHPDILGELRLKITDTFDTIIIPLIFSGLIWLLFGNTSIRMSLSYRGLNLASELFYMLSSGYFIFFITSFLPFYARQRNFQDYLPLMIFITTASTYVLLSYLDFGTVTPLTFYNGLFFIPLFGLLAEYIARRLKNAHSVYLIFILSRLLRIFIK